jgi:hypothetical protein
MKTIAHSLIIIGSIFAATASGALAQEYFNRIDTPSELAPVTTATDQVAPDESTNPSETPAEKMDISNPGLPPQATGEDKYNMALGPVHFGVAAGFGVEFNDNINLAPSGQQASDIILRPSVTVDSSYAFSELNALRFSLGISYAAYLNHSNYDTILISPNSILAFTMHVGPVAITLRDRFSYQEDPFDEPVLSGVAIYRRLENQVGVQADWAINDALVLTGGYDHYNLWTYDAEFASLQHSVDTFFVKPSYQIAPAVKVGIDASASIVTFSENIQNNGDNYMVGPFVDIGLTQNTHIYAEGGYQLFEFDQTGTILDNSNANTWYARVDIDNRLSEAFSQRLSFTKSAEVGFGSNFYDLYHLEYAIDWKITDLL